nr:MAG TPA: hypothetical protein [Caudoviricetes sp.]
MIVLLNNMHIRECRIVICCMFTIEKRNFS